MSFDKFFHLMEFRQAFLPSIRTLRSAPGSQGDALEGVWSPYDLFLRNGIAQQLDIVMNQIWPSIKENLDDEAEEISLGPTTVATPFGQSETDSYHSDIHQMAAWIDVWCWNRFDYETVGMWRAYGSQPGSVMIKTTVGALRKSLHIEGNSKLLVEDVLYSDRQGKLSDSKGEYTVFLQKSRAYAYEQEIRVLVLDPNDNFKSETDRFGRSVQVELETLILDVVPHYQTPAWMVEAIDAIVLRTLGRKSSQSSIQREIEAVEVAKSFGR